MRRTKFKKKLLVLGMSLLCIFGTVVTVNAAECEHEYEEGMCIKCKEFENECVDSFGNDYEVYFEANIPYSTYEPLTWNTYKFYDENKAEVAMLEILHGYAYTKCWLTVDGVTREFSEAGLTTMSYGDEAYVVLRRSGTKWSLSDILGIEGFEYIALVNSEAIPEIEADLEVAWDEASKPGTVAWNNIDDKGIVMYRLQLLRDGEYIAWGFGYDEEVYNVDFSSYINESGTYTVRLFALCDKNLGVKTVYSDEFVYERPDEEVGTVEKVWWTSSEGEELPTILNWLSVPGAGGYEVTLYVEAEYGWSYNTYNHYSDELVVSKDFAGIIEEEMKSLEEFGLGEFVACTCEIRALSGDITVVANTSSVFENYEEDYILWEAVEETIMDSIVSSTTETIINDIDIIGIDNMADAMQNNTEIRNSVKNAENKFVEANDIEELLSIVEHAKLAADAVTDVAGAGFNATSGGKIGIVISETVEPQAINEALFDNAVWMDITLKLNGNAMKDELKAPVTITMEIPASVKKEKMVIIHCLDNGDKKIIYPVVNDNGTITFSLKSFDSFVFANIAELVKGEEDITTTIYNGIDYAAVYNYEYYTSKYPEITGNVLEYFVTIGMSLGHQASEEFNLVAYQSNYPDLGVAFGSDNTKYYMHYINNGKTEGRNAKVVLVESDTKYYGVEYADVYNYDYYINNNPDLKAAFGDNKAAALIHFANMGMKEGRQACENFGAKIYKFNYPELQDSFGEDMVLYYHHYMDYGKDEGRNGATRDFSAYCEYEGVNYTPVYNYEDYIERNPDVFNAYGLDANAVLKHFVTVGMAEGRQGSDDFNYNIYRSNYPDLEVAFGENRAEYYHHYINSGYNEGRNAATSDYTSDTVYAGVDYADVYSYDYYVTANPDVAAAIGDNKIAILAHFVRNGMAEGRQASAEFNVRVYMEKNTDLVEEFGDDLKAYYMHYIEEGKAAGREAI